MTLGVGQFCTKPGLVFVVEGASHEAFTDRLTALIDQTPPGAFLTEGIGQTYARLLDARCGQPGVRTLARGQAALLSTDIDTFLASPGLQEEIFGPASLLVRCRSTNDFLRGAEVLEGQLTATLWGEPGELEAQDDLLWTLQQKAGRIVFNGFPIGVEVGEAIVHGGPFPATTDSRFSSVGTRAIYRFLRPVAWQEP